MLTLKKSLERCQESKWEHKFCISKDREIAVMAPYSCIMLNFFLFPLSITEVQALACVTPDPFSLLFNDFSIFSAVFFYAEICFLCKMGHILRRYM